MSKTPKDSWKNDKKRDNPNWVSRKNKKKKKKNTTARKKTQQQKNKTAVKKAFKKNK